MWPLPLQVAAAHASPLSLGALGESGPAFKDWVSMGDAAIVGVELAQSLEAEAWVFFQAPLLNKSLPF